MCPSGYDFNKKSDYFQTNFGLKMSVICELHNNLEIEVLSEVNSYQFNLLHQYINNKTQPQLTLKSKENNVQNETFEIIQNMNNTLVFKHIRQNIQIEIKRGDLLHEKVNILVNAANSRLILGGKYLNFYNYIY